MVDVFEDTLNIGAGCPSDIAVNTNEMGVPPALPGRHAKFDRYGSPSKKLLA
jgi:hypothetical protein